VCRDVVEGGGKISRRERKGRGTEKAENINTDETEEKRETQRKTREILRPV
jgi:hypothetical protein